MAEPVPVVAVEVPLSEDDSEEEVLVAADEVVVEADAAAANNADGAAPPADADAADADVFPVGLDKKPRLLAAMAATFKARSMECSPLQAAQLLYFHCVELGLIGRLAPGQPVPLTRDDMLYLPSTRGAMIAQVIGWQRANEGEGASNGATPPFLSLRSLLGTTDEEAAGPALALMDLLQVARKVSAPPAAASVAAPALETSTTALTALATAVESARADSAWKPGEEVPSLKSRPVSMSQGECDLWVGALYSGDRALRREEVPEHDFTSAQVPVAAMWMSHKRQSNAYLPTFDEFPFTSLKLGVRGGRALLAAGEAARADKGPTVLLCFRGFVKLLECVGRQVTVTRAQYTLEGADADAELPLLSSGDHAEDLLKTTTTVFSRLWVEPAVAALASMCLRACLSCVLACCAFACALAAARPRARASAFAL